MILTATSTKIARLFRTVMEECAGPAEQSVLAGQEEAQLAFTEAAQIIQ